MRRLLAWRDLVKEDADTACLVWQGRRDANGYARWGSEWAHRRVYEAEIGPIPERHELDHLCCNPPCVNPEHLEPVTRAEHVARTYRRSGKDDEHGRAAYLRSVGLTYGEIAEALSYTSRSGAATAVTAAIRKGLIDPNEVPRQYHLTEADREDIVTLRVMGVPLNDIGLWYGIHAAHVSRISRRVVRKRGKGLAA